MIDNIENQDNTVWVCLFIEEHSRRSLWGPFESRSAAHEFACAACGPHETVDVYSVTMPRKGYITEILDDESAIVMWSDGLTQAIRLNPGDADLIRHGADPVADLWEDGNGRAVCHDCSVEGAQI